MPIERTGRGLVIVLWSLAGALAPEASAQGSPERDRAVLEAFYDATGGPGWTRSTNWKTAAPLNQWHGVSTAFGGRVIQLSLADNGLAGPIPAGLGDLAYLQRLDLRGNDLTGPIPARLGNLTRLRELWLRENDLSGPVPDALGNLESLRSLDLSLNGLTGPIPGAMGRLARLSWLSFGANSLSGPVPEALGSLVSLESLHLDWNPLTGPLPESLTALTRLEWLTIDRTAACAPGDDAFQEWLAGVNFTGETCNRPPEPRDESWYYELTDWPIGAPMTGRFIDPDRDPLTYAAVSSHPGVVTVSVSEDIVWLVPGEAGTATVTVTARDPDGLSADREVAVTVSSRGAPRGDWDALWALHGATGGREWTDRAGWLTDAPLGEWYGVTTDAAGRVTGLDLADNGLAGTIPPALGALANLEELDLGGNALGGPIPDELGSLANLRRLVLRDNALGSEAERFQEPEPGLVGLTGPIPPSLGGLTNLEELDLGGNALFGPIPAELGELTGLRRLDLRDNDLTGSIPAELGELTGLRRLDLGDNALTGPVPGVLGSLTTLETLDLRGNGLTGPIPAALRGLVNLQRLDLYRNPLTGAVPAWLGDLSRLRELSLGGTALTGPVPTTLGQLPDLELLDLSGAWGLSGPLPPDLPMVRSEGMVLDTFLSRACAPVAWQEWLERIEFDGTLCEEDRQVTIDVAVIYTPTAREALGGTAEIEAVIDLVMADANQILAASGLQLRLALVERSEVAYEETGDAYVDRERMETPGDGHLDEVLAMRDRVGADLVAMIARSSFCGIGRIGGAFSITNYRCTADGMVFAHELGHNLGLLHDRPQILRSEGDKYYTYPSSSGLTPPHPAYGWVNPHVATGGPQSRWRTVMAYSTQCVDVYAYCPRLPRFSNPRQSYNGDPLGIPYGAGELGGATGPADVVAVLEVTGPAVARWRERFTGANRRPAVAGTLPDRRLGLGGTLAVDVSQAFADPDGDALTYTVSSSRPDTVTVMAAGARVTLAALKEGTATIQVTATDPGGLSTQQAFTVTVEASAGLSFTDDPIVPGVTPVKAVHFTELRVRIDAIRAATGLGRFAWTDPVLTAGVPIRLAHLLELRSALAAAHAAAGRAAPSWTDPAPTPGTTLIRAAHLMELRAAVVALE